MPLSLKTIGSTGYRDQWNKRFGLMQVNRFHLLCQLKSNCCSVCFSAFTDYTTRRAHWMASEWSYKDRNLSYRGKSQWNFDQGKGNLVRVSSDIRIIGVWVNQVKWLKSGGGGGGKPREIGLSLSYDVAGVRVNRVRVIRVLLHILWLILFHTWPKINLTLIYNNSFSQNKFSSGWIYASQSTEIRCSV